MVVVYDISMSHKERGKGEHVSKVWVWEGAYKLRNLLRSRTLVWVIMLKLAPRECVYMQHASFEVKHILTFVYNNSNEPANKLNRVKGA